LQYSRQLTEEDEKSIKKQAPILSQFKEQIDQFEKDEEIECTKVLNLWLRADISPFKSSLLNCVKRWSYGFNKNLLDCVIDYLMKV
jgi:dynein heavy chain